MGESVGVLWNACRVGIDVCIMSPMITYEGLVSWRTILEAYQACRLEDGLEDKDHIS